MSGTFTHVTPLPKVNLILLGVWEMWGPIGSLPWLGEDNGQNKTEKAVGQKI